MMDNYIFIVDKKIVDKKRLPPDKVLEHAAALAKEHKTTVLIFKQYGVVTYAHK